MYFFLFQYKYFNVDRKNRCSFRFFNYTLFKCRILSFIRLVIHSLVLWFLLLVSVWEWPEAAIKPAAVETSPDDQFWFLPFTRLRPRRHYVRFIKMDVVGPVLFATWLGVASLAGLQLPLLKLIRRPLPPSITSFINKITATAHIITYQFIVFTCSIPSSTVI